MNIREQVPLAPLTTFRIGGPARRFMEATTPQEVCEAIACARERGWPLFVLGGGSNLLVSDRGFPGLVIKIAMRGIEEHRENGKQLFDVGAGEDWDAFVAHTVRRNCAGLECLSGIPGTVGGTPVQNVGAYGQEVSESITEVQAIDTASGELHTLCGEACGFQYRGSIFNSIERGRYIIVRVTFALEPGGLPRLDYADLKKQFVGRTATLAETRDAVLAIRRSKAMLIVEGDPDCRSAGSFFKNPVLSDGQYKELEQQATARGLTVPSYPGLASQKKVAAAWLVEQAGFYKGYTRGPVGISSKHALAIVNRGGASAADLIALMKDIQQAVFDKFGIQLQPEPVFVGF